jgi:hypothetical protein
MYMVHIFPAVAFAINHYITDTVVYEGHAKGIATVGILYSIVNAHHAITTGEPLYSFLTWTDYKSPLICVGFIAGFLMIFGSVAKLSRMMKPWMKKQVLKED